MKNLFYAFIVGVISGFVIVLILLNIVRLIVVE